MTTLCNCTGCRICGLADEAVLNIMELVRIEEHLTDQETNGELIQAAKAVMDLRFHLLTEFIKKGEATPCGQAV